MDDLIIFENGHYDNFDADSRGAELSLEGTWASGVRGRASYSIQRAENRSSNADFPNSPEHLIKLNVSVPVVKEKVFASLEYQYTSSRHTVFTDTSAATLPGADTQAFGVLNFTLFGRNLKPVKNLEFSLSVYNLLDQSYADPSTPNHLEDQLPRDGRSFRLKLIYKF